MREKQLHVRGCKIAQLRSKTASSISEKKTAWKVESESKIKNGQATALLETKSGQKMLHGTWVNMHDKPVSFNARKHYMLKSIAEHPNLESLGWNTSEKPMNILQS